MDREKKSHRKKVRFPKKKSIKVVAKMAEKKKTKKKKKNVQTSFCFFVRLHCGAVFFSFFFTREVVLFFSKIIYLFLFSEMCSVCVCVCVCVEGGCFIGRGSFSGRHVEPCVNPREKKKETENDSLHVIGRRFRGICSGIPGILGPRRSSRRVGLAERFISVSFVLFCFVFFCHPFDAQFWSRNSRFFFKKQIDSLSLNDR